MEQASAAFSVPQTLRRMDERGMQAAGTVGSGHREEAGHSDTEYLSITASTKFAIFYFCEYTTLFRFGPDSLRSRVDSSWRGRPSRFMAVVFSSRS